MLRHLLSLLLLTVLSLGLFAGPHPCKAAHPSRESSPSCHEEGQGSSGPGLQKEDPQQEEGGDCCNTVCRHACNATAIAEAGQAAGAPALVSQAVAEVVGSDLSLFAHPIDHVPLA
jgi:hypothetical protein